MKYAVKIYFLAAFHRVSYKNSPANLDSGGKNQKFDNYLSEISVEAIKTIV